MSAKRVKGIDFIDFDSPVALDRDRSTPLSKVQSMAVSPAVAAAVATEVKPYKRYYRRYKRRRYFQKRQANTQVPIYIDFTKPMKCPHCANNVQVNL